MAPENMPPPNFAWVHGEYPAYQDEGEEAAYTSQSFWVVPGVNNQEHGNDCQHQSV